MCADRKSLNVLIVNNVEAVSARVSELISGLAYVGGIRVASTQPEALNTLTELQPEIVLLNLQLKNGGGLGLLRALRQSKQHPVIIAFTDHPSPLYRDHALLNGANYFLDNALLDSLPMVLESLWSD